MPLMMDDDMEVDIDDLFGDGAGLSLPTRPPSKELHQRIDDLRGSGCCQRFCMGPQLKKAQVTATKFPRLSTLLIAFATTAKQLRTVRAVIDWGFPKASDKIAPASLPLNPSIKTRHLAVTSWLHETSGETLNASHMESSMVQLTHLEFLPPSSDASSSRITPPTIMTVRSHLPTSIDHYNQDVHTIVDRWEVREKSQSIHPAFEQLSSRRNSVGVQAGPVAFLKKLESFTINKVLLASQPMNLGRVICFAYSDSSVEYRDRNTMNEVFTDGDLDRVWHLSQIGFSYTEDEPCLQVALSPSYCSIVQIQNDGKVKWKQLDYHMGDIGSSMDDAQYAGVVAALALSCASAVLTNVNYDDLLATAYKYAKNNLGYDWLIELSRILKRGVDYLEESHFDILIRNTTIQLCLSIQNSLGFKGEFNPRTFPSKFAWIVLQLRNIVVLVTMAANMKVPGPNNEKATPLEDPEVINLLVGSVRWVLDLMAWITDTLLALPSTLPSNISLTDISLLSLPELLTHLRATNTISLHLLLSSPSRGFLLAICRRLQHLDFIARKAITHHIPGASPVTPQGQPAQPPLLSPSLRAAYMQIATLTSSTIIRVKTFETLLSTLTSLIKSSYASHNPPLSGSPTAEKARNVLEMKMLFGGEIPNAFTPVIVELFKGIPGSKSPPSSEDNEKKETEENGKEIGLLAAVREEIEPAKLWFADFIMLEVDEDQMSVAKRKGLRKTMDCFRKAWLFDPPPSSSKSNLPPDDKTKDQAARGSRNNRWRRCARCAAVMEDILSQRQALQWLIMQQRRCFCSGYWDTLGVGDVVA
ncbi:hypothetical protein B7494_g3202 [Chlorociboria aeruginascens]|nr:hypothetical protein B7494_g3202 [Chlorociboria aeruginascens]